MKGKLWKLYCQILLFSSHRSFTSLKGDTVQGGTKPVTLETGKVIQVPLFINQDDLVKVDTRTGRYIERVRE